ncbi:M23 family metallopeptidase [Candidatus Shapirobacteria bacterium]|nr:M23 family metallopeptidase [Candidatus Shapirobacteria bacterium]MBM4402329.1 M23 family metallopeptidase [Candidatus Cloacimonadota bacterium]
MINSKLKTQNSKLQLKFQNYKFLLTLLLLFTFYFLLFTLLNDQQAWRVEAQSTIGILRGVSCIPANWLCKTEDTVLPDVLCCWWHCLPKEILPPHTCPTNADLGQKDGTGKTGNDRHYYYYDYDLEKVVDVPPALPAQTTLPPAPPTSCSAPFGWPSGQGRVTLSYRACHLYSGCHTGIDIVTKENNPVYATLSGKVVFAGDSGNAGKKVVVECGGWEYAVVYYHLNSISVKAGDQVVAGQTKIGTEGKSGRVSAAHLHYEVWKNGQLTNPAAYLPYSGCVDWTEGGVGGGFCPGSGCTPECPDTVSCEKAREQGRCGITLNPHNIIANILYKIAKVFLVT